MTRDTLYQHILTKRSYLSVGLDPDLTKMPLDHLDSDDPIFDFNRQIIDATRDLCVAYKPNTAFYEAHGVSGWQSLQRTIDYIGDEHLIIADAKRGDIGNTSRQYARAFYETMGADALTVAPYMGEESVRPFLEWEDKWVILLALTSNKGSRNFQFTPQEQGEPLYHKVIATAQQWGTPDNLMFVVGATHPEQLRDIREAAPEHFFLVPGVGAQGGDLQAVTEAGRNAQLGLLVNSSRGILYASKGADFAAAARKAARKLQHQMSGLLDV